MAWVLRNENLRYVTPRTIKHYQSGIRLVGEEGRPCTGTSRYVKVTPPGWPVAVPFIGVYINVTGRLAFKQSLEVAFAPLGSATVSISCIGGVGSEV